MEDFYSHKPAFRSRLSFIPLLRQCQKLAENGQRKTIAGSLCERFNNIPELSGPIDEYDVLSRHKGLIADAASLVFPQTILDQYQLNAIATPFSHKIIFTSPAFRKMFMGGKKNYLTSMDVQVAQNITNANINLAYKLILKEFYHMDLEGGYSFICAYPDLLEDIHNYFELTWNPDLIDISTSVKLPELPVGFSLNCHHINDLAHYPQLRSILPVEDFIFEGIILLSVKEVTNREAANQIRNILGLEGSLESPATHLSFNEQLKYLLKLDNLKAGIASFQVSCNYYFGQPWGILTELMGSAGDLKSVSDFIYEQLKINPHFVFSVTDKNRHKALTAFLEKHNWSYAFYTGLFFNNEIIGYLELYSVKPFDNLHPLIVKLKTVVPFMQRALQRKENLLRHKIDRLIKDHFTAVHTSVEWKFNMTAIQYLLNQQRNQAIKMEEITFQSVFPLYAAIDIRNSSTERNRAIQRDLIQQLQWAKKLFEDCLQYCSFPLLDAILQETAESIEKISGFLLSSDEQAVYTLLKTEVAELLFHLMEMAPQMKKDITHYFETIEKSSGILNSHQKSYEESVMAVNDYLSDFIDREQQHAQKIYPHYFERFATDGIDFNMYIGQSIAPNKKFNFLYLKNLRLWQLKMLAIAARHLQSLKEKLPLPLETTQLLLVYRQPISISFRTAERKFDVDGVYNARYEVVKKRIDKVYIKNSNERLTKPGTIAIIYFQEKEADEYMRYINFLKKEELLEETIEKLELEELQGINGLKALRVTVNMTKEEKGQVLKGATAAQSIPHSPATD
jgi:hypothetical protein